MGATDFVPEVKTLEGMVVVCVQQVEPNLDWCVINIALNNAFWAHGVGRGDLWRLGSCGSCRCDMSTVLDFMSYFDYLRNELSFAR